MMRFIWMLAVLIPSLAIIAWVVRARISRFRAQQDRKHELLEQQMLVLGEAEIIDQEAELSELQERLAEKRKRDAKRDETF